MNDGHFISLPPEIDAELVSFGPDDRASLVEAWLVSGAEPADQDEARAAAWRRLQASLAPAPLQPAVQRPAAVLRLTASPALRLVGRYRFAAAAVVLALIAVSFLLRPDGTTYSAPMGVAVTEVELPDGSLVQMAPGSSLTVSRSFGERNRDVILHGEAFFDVERQAVPFVVETFSARVEVLGTAFNVRARGDELAAATLVDLDRGSVRVVSAALPEVAVRLEPGETTSVPSGSVPTAPANVDLEAATWRAGGLAYANAPIGNVLDEIGRRYQVVISAPEDIRLAKVSLFRHSSASVEELLGDLSDTAGLRYRRTAQGFEIFVP